VSMSLVTVQLRSREVLRWLDDVQRRHGVVGFPYAVLRKYFDDEGPKLAALLTYYGFLSLFPLLLVVVVVLTEVLASRPTLQVELMNQLVGPRLKPDIEQALEQLPPSGIPLAIGVFGLLFSGLGGVLSASATVNRIWAVPRRDRFGVGRRYMRALTMLLVVLAGALTAAGWGVLASVADMQAVERAGSAAGTFVVILVVLLFAHKLLASRALPVRQIWVSCVLGSVAVLALVSWGAALLPALIVRSGPIYGSFATVVGVFALLYLTSQAVVLSAEVSPVRTYRLFPRAVIRTARTSADVRALTLLAQEQELLPDERVVVTFTSPNDIVVGDPAQP
jgi:membrane protein